MGPRSALAVATLFAACEARPELAGWVADCDQMEDGPTCVLATPGAQSITLFVRGAERPIHATLEGEPLPLTLTRAAEGFELHLRPNRVGTLRVQADNGDFEVEVRDTERADPAAVRTSTEARADLRDGRWAPAVEALDRAAASHAARGAWSRAVRDQLTAAYALLYHGHRPDEAQRRLDRVLPWLRHDRYGWALHPYYQGLQAIRAGTPTRALSALRDARRRLASLREASLVAGVDEVLAVTLQQLGRREEAELTMQRLLETAAGGPCEQARRLNNAAWAGLLAADATASPPRPRVRDALARTHAAYETPACRARPGRRTVPLHRALGAVLEGRFEDAQTILRAHPLEDDRLDAWLWRHELEARVAIGLGRPASALAHLDAAQARLAPGALPDAEWRLERWRGRALAAAGAPKAASAAYARADARLDDAALRIPFGAGRVPFAEARRRGAIEWAELRLAAGEVEAAACVLRRMRARHLARAAERARLQQADPTARAAWAAHVGALRRLRAESEEAAEGAWALDADAHAAYRAAQATRRAEARRHLSAALAAVEAQTPPWSCAPAADGVLTLVLVRIAGGALVLAVGEGEARAHSGSADADPGSWLAPFDDVLEATRRVRLVVDPTLALPRPHAWPWRGRPLNAQRPVTFALDLGARPPARARPRHALLVTDPERNLPGARAEANGVRRALEANEWPLTHLSGAQAGPAEVRAAMRQASLLHFSGHARARSDAPETDALRLHRGALFSQDILTSEGVPAAVVLTGCRTATLEPERIGLAQAFLLAGAQQVLAAADDVPDDLGSTIGVGMYAASQGPGLDLAERFHQVAARHDAAGDARWSAFRVWEP